MAKKKREIRLEDITLGKVPPQSVDLEEKILGHAMTNPDACSLVTEIMLPEFFYKESHQKIMSAILTLSEKNEPIDVMTVTNQLKINSELEAIGGPYYMTQLISNLSSHLHTEYYCRIIMQNYLKREIISLSQDAIKRSYEDGEDCFEIADHVVDNIEISLSKILVGASTDMSEAIHKNLVYIKMGMQTKGENYYKTGYHKLDETLNIRGNQVMLVGGKNGAGKTKWIIAIITRLFRYHPDDISVLWYAMEDGDDKILRNMVAQKLRLTDKEQSSINYKLTEEEFNLMVSIHAELKRYDIEFVNEESSIRDIGKHFRKFRRQSNKKLKILIIDNFMLLKDHDNFRQQTEADDYISREINKWGVKTSKDKDALVILVHHFTDEQLEKTNLSDGYRPREKHIKGSTRIRDIATQTILINRPAQYPDLLKAYPNEKEIVEKLFLVDVCKHRDGDTGLIQFFGTLGYNIFQEV